MSQPKRTAAFILIVVLVVVSSTAYGVLQWRRTQVLANAEPGVAVAQVQAPTDEPFVAFRHSGLDDHYGTVALVPVTDPAGPRWFTDITCDRVHASRRGASCLSRPRGVLATTTVTLLDSTWHPVVERSTAGVPSRTRVAADGSLVATTTFVAGHSYLDHGFSTSTEVRRFDGPGYGNLEDFALEVDGRATHREDVNVWGASFAGPDTFYATVSTAGETYLARGSLARRTLVTVASGVECPSVSPDGTRIGFKHTEGSGASMTWLPAVLDLDTGERTVLRGETRSVDDQLEWLDDDTLLYGLARPEEPGVTDVWALDVRASARPRLFIEQAWSPAVVR